MALAWFFSFSIVGIIVWRLIEYDRKSRDK